MTENLSFASLTKHYAAIWFFKFFIGDLFFYYFFYFISLDFQVQLERNFNGSNMKFQQLGAMAVWLFALIYSINIDK